MAAWRRFLNWALRRTRKPVNWKVVRECVMDIRESQINTRLQLEGLKNKFTNSKVIETLCVTECELCKTEQALKILRDEGF